jgi:hypothetical protein
MVLSLRKVMPKEEFIGEDLVTAAVLHRGLISGYHAAGAAFVGTRD